MSKADSIRILKGEQSSRQAEMAASQAKVAAIDEKLERLESAKKTVVAVQQDVHDIKRSILAKKDQPDWKGQRKEDFLKRWETFSSDYTSFQEEVNTFYDAICDEITRLENQKHNEENIIGWCQSRLNDIGNAIEKLFHTKEG